jgi:NADH-quinone oxidoreductase subunit N
MWAPDVYEGAPTPVTAFFSVVPKAAGLAVLLRLLGSFWVGAGRPGQLGWLLGAAAALTMLVGNLAALRQRNIKRILAYSSIAHSGYMLIAVVSGDGPGLAFYLVVYAFMNIGAFSAVVALGQSGKERLDLDEFAGTGLRSPWIGAMLSIFLLSLAGFPPTGGFLAKFLVFDAAVQRGLSGLVIIAVMASLVSVYYYLRIIVVMYMSPSPEEVSLEGDQPGVFLVLFFCLYAVLQLGIAPGNILPFIRQAMNF